MADYYQSLELPRGATEDEIRRRYRQLALRFHPDRAGPEGAERFKEIQLAYDVLSNPQKRKIYDRFGAAAVDNPVSDALIIQLGGRFILCLMALAVVLFALLIVIFTAFLVAYVDGRLVARDANSVDDHGRIYWNYVKVFSPLFIIDIIIGIPTFVAFCMALCTLRVKALLWTLLVLSLIVLTILVPVAKDANDMTSLRGGNDFHSWRCWLVPLYVAGALLTLLHVITNPPTGQMRERLKANGLDGLWTYMNLSLVLSFLRGISVVLFGALIACRADEVITTNYFVVVALPFYVFGLLALLDSMLYRIFFHRVRGDSESYCYIFVTFIPLIITLGLALASVSMVSRRLNDLDRVSHGAAGKVLSLNLALIPVYILLSLPFLFALGLLCSVYDSSFSQGSGAGSSHSGDAATDKDGHEENETHSSGERAANGGNDGDGRSSRNHASFQEGSRNRDGYEGQQDAHDMLTGFGREGYPPRRPQQRLSDID